MGATDYWEHKNGLLITSMPHDKRNRTAEPDTIWNVCLICISVYTYYTVKLVKLPLLYCHPPQLRPATPGL